MKKSHLAHALFIATYLAVGALQVHATNWDLKTLVLFNGSNGRAPRGGLIADAQGNFYGTTTEGGSGRYGTVFKLAAGTHSLTTIAAFNNANGAGPNSGLIADANGNLYGTTYYGGTNNVGTIFKLAANTYNLTTLANFNTTNGSHLLSSLFSDANGNFYGTTFHGGTYLNGSVFKLDATTFNLTTLASFKTTSGYFPESELIADSHGNFYGTTASGGTNGYGTVYQLTAGSNVLTPLVSFNGTNGKSPIGGLNMDAKGNLYGTTLIGGEYGHGTVFKIDANTHVLTTLASFNGSNGHGPDCTMIADAAGNLFGMTTTGGSSNLGTIFKLTAGTNILTTLVEFNEGIGTHPFGGLLPDDHGNLYGTTMGGGVNNNGTVFELTNTGFVVIPETTSLSLLAVGTTALLARRKRSR